MSGDRVFHYILGIATGLSIAGLIAIFYPAPIYGPTFEPGMVSNNHKTGYCYMTLADGRKLEWSEPKSKNGYQCHNPFVGASK